MQKLFVVLVVSSCALSCGHGTLTWPNSTRQKGTLATAGACVGMECYWFTQPTEIPGAPTLNEERLRTVNVKRSEGPLDYTRKNPWRAPGTAPVKGLGCGVAGGSAKHDNLTGGFTSVVGQGADGTELEAKEPVVWLKGSTAEVAWAISANHGGGYSYRVCPKTSQITEECFQSHVLRFANKNHHIVYGDVRNPRGAPVQMPEQLEIPMVLVTEGTHPSGSHWARNPIPNCRMFDAAECQNLSSGDRVVCTQEAGGDGMMQCPPGMTEFPEPLPGFSGEVPSWHSAISGYPGNHSLWVHQWSTTEFEDNMMSGGFPFSIMDLVEIPQDLPAGGYLLSWRWDSEQSAQVWQSCADVELVDPEVESLTILP